MSQSTLIRFDGEDESSRFRSRLENEIAGELDSLDIHYAYELPWVREFDGYSPRYLPDFTIEPSERTAELEIPRFIEGKPQQFIYDLRDTLGVTRRAGERFIIPVRVENADHRRIKDIGIEELWKPKLLAEVSGEAVLVCGRVGGTSALSVEMRPTEILFSRSHPFVNQVGLRQRLEREENQRYWAAETKRRDAERAAEAAKRATEMAAQRTALRASIIAGTIRSVEPKFASRCSGCGSYGEDGRARLCATTDGGQAWFRLCVKCERGAA
jgi:hypothetical protein